MNTHPILHSKIQPSPQKYILLTGATGLVGRYLMRDLFLQGRQLAVIARSGKKLSVEQRVEEILQMWESQLGFALPRPVMFSGNVAEPNLGLSPEDESWIKAHCSEIIHNAAVLQFHETGFESEPWRTNLAGTGQVLDFAKRAGHSQPALRINGVRLRPAGRTGITRLTSSAVRSFEMTMNEASLKRNDLFMRPMDLIQKTIFRPGCNRGRFRTGYTSTYHGLYLYLRLLATLVPQQETDENGKVNHADQATNERRRTAKPGACRLGVCRS